MKIKIVVEFDKETGQYSINEHSDNITIEHSGSSYLKILGDSIYGTIYGLPKMDGFDFKMHQMSIKEKWNPIVISLKTLDD